MRFLTIIFFFLLFISLLSKKKSKKQKERKIPDPEEDSDEEKSIDELENEYAKSQEKIKVGSVLDLKRCPKDDPLCLEYEFFTLEPYLELNTTKEMKVKKFNKLLAKSYDENNFYVDIVKNSSMYEYGVFAKKDFRRGETIFTAKKGIPIFDDSSYTPAGFKDNYLTYWHTVLPNFITINSQIQKLVLGLLYQTAYSFDSYYEEWIHMLPKKVKALFITLTSEEIALFEYDREYHSKIKELRREYIEGYYQLCDVIQNGLMQKHPQMVKDYFRRPNISFSDYVWARYIIDTRKVEIDIDEKKSDFSVILLLDLMKPDVYEKHIFPNHIEKLQYVQPFQNEVKVNAHYDIKKGERITTHHLLRKMPETNHYFLLYYGYVPEKNCHECVHINLIPTEVVRIMPREIFVLLTKLGYPGFNYCINKYTPNLESRLRFTAFLINMLPDEMLEFNKKYEEQLKINPEQDKFLLAMSLMKKPEKLKIDYRKGAYETVNQYVAKYVKARGRLEEFRKENGNNERLDLIEKFFDFYIELSTSVRTDITNSLKDFDQSPKSEL